MASKTPSTAKTTARKSTSKTAAEGAAAENGSAGTSKEKFSKAIEEARAGAQALTQEAQAKAGAYKEQLTARSGDWAAEAKDLAGQAKDRASELANEGKARTSDALSSLGKIVADNAGTIDDKLGARYGDYARTAARSMQETAAKIEAKDLNELGEDAKEFVRKSPGVAIGLAAVAGFLVARLLKGGSND